MLVCNVSLQPPRTLSGDIAEIAAATAISTGPTVSTLTDILETAEAIDTTAAEGNIFPTLVDDPASASDIVNAYLGENMHEAANAADIVSTEAGAFAVRSAMMMGVFVNSTASREAYAAGVMVNL